MPFNTWESNSNVKATSAMKGAGKEDFLHTWYYCSLAITAYCFEVCSELVLAKGKRINYFAEGKYTRQWQRVSVTRRTEFKICAIEIPR